MQQVSGATVYIYTHTYTCKASTDIKVCHLTECACISEYWDNSFFLFVIQMGFNIQDSRI